MHGGPHQRGFASLCVRLQRALLANEGLAQQVITSLHCAKQCGLPISILVVNLGALCDEELADLVSAKLGSQQEGCLPLLRDKVSLCILFHEPLHRLQVTFGGCPHQRSLVLVVALVHLSTLFVKELAHLPVAVRRGLHQGVLLLLRRVVGSDEVLVHEHVADVKMTSEGGPHEHLPALIILQVQGSTLIQQQPDNVALPLLRSLHQSSDTLVVLCIKHPPFLGGNRLLSITTS
mmetsp:Transcript_10477/g.30748  ORF Transcript_10477/g.30748 Transcript_10477/m.30748 type:complete len:234 (-) Transcript_10477:422-1123(-)